MWPHIFCADDDDMKDDGDEPIEDFYAADPRKKSAGRSKCKFIAADISKIAEKWANAKRRKVKMPTV